MAKIKCVDNFGNPREFDEAEYIDRESVHGIAINNMAILLVEDGHSKFWDFSGGGVEKGETLLEALKREFVEETGIHTLTVKNKVESSTDYFFNVHTQEPWRSQRHFYLVEVRSNELNASPNVEDISQAKFIPIAEISSYKVKDKAKELISALIHPV